MHVGQVRRMDCIYKYITLTVILQVTKKMTQWKYYLFPLGAIFIWAGNTIVSKLSAGLIEPAAISFYRWVLAAVVMTPFLLKPVWKERTLLKLYWKKIAVLSMLGMVLYQSLAYFAASTSSATSMGMIASLLPLMTVLLSCLLMKEPLTIGAVLGLSLSLYGVTILISSGHPGMLLEHGIVVGDFLMLIASLAYSLYGVLLRKWALPFSSWNLLYVQILLAVIMLFPGFMMAPSSPINADNLPLVLYAGIGASIFSQILWMRSVAYIGASRSSMFMNLFPIVTVLIAMIALNESLHWYHIVGGGVTLVGVLLAQTLKKPLIGRAPDQSV